MRIASVGHALFAALMIGVGIQGLITGEFTTVWQPVPRGVPGREVLAYVCALLSLASGIGLLWRRTAALAASALLGSLVVWLLVWRIRALFIATLMEGSWSLADTLVMTAATWVLFAWFATDWDRQHLGFATGEKGLRIARVLYGLGMIPFGYAHFANVKGTAALVPGWLPWHLGWAYFTGGTFRRGRRGDAHRPMCTAGSRALDFADGPLPAAGVGTHPDGGFAKRLPTDGGRDQSGVDRRRLAGCGFLQRAASTASTSAANDWLSAFVPAAEPRW